MQIRPNIDKLYTKSKLSKRRVDTYQFQVRVMTEKREMANQSRGPNPWDQTHLCLGRRPMDLKRRRRTVVCQIDGNGPHKAPRPIEPSGAPPCWVPTFWDPLNLSSPCSANDWKRLRLCMDERERTR